jgi:hypothetical protein
MTARITNIEFVTDYTLGCNDVENLVITIDAPRSEQDAIGALFKGAEGWSVDTTTMFSIPELRLTAALTCGIFVNDPSQSDLHHRAESAFSYFFDEMSENNIVVRNGFVKLAAEVQQKDDRQYPVVIVTVDPAAHLRSDLTKALIRALGYESSVYLRGAWEDFAETMGYETDTSSHLGTEGMGQIRFVIDYPLSSQGKPVTMGYQVARQVAEELCNNLQKVLGISYLSPIP